MHVPTHPVHFELRSQSYQEHGNACQEEDNHGSCLECCTSGALTGSVTSAEGARFSSTGVRKVMEEYPLLSSIFHPVQGRLLVLFCAMDGNQVNGI